MSAALARVGVGVDISISMKAAGGGGNQKYRELSGVGADFAGGVAWVARGWGPDTLGVDDGDEGGAGK